MIYAFQCYIGSFNISDTGSDSIFAIIYNNGLCLCVVFRQCYSCSLFEQLIIGYTSLARFTKNVIPTFKSTYYK